MDDLTPCPFGIYEDTPMQDVPASWLIWFHNEVFKEVEMDMEPKGDRAIVYVYCQKHLSDLAVECPDKEILGYDEDEDGEDREWGYG